jgi:hypothetical protein
LSATTTTTTVPLGQLLATQTFYLGARSLLRCPVSHDNRIVLGLANSFHRITIQRDGQVTDSIVKYRFSLTFLLFVIIVERPKQRTRRCTMQNIEVKRYHRKNRKALAPYNYKYNLMPAFGITVRIDRHLSVRRRSQI